MADPLHQFVIEPIIPFHAGGFDLSYTNSSLWMTVTAVAVVWFLSLSLRRRDLVPGRMQLAGEMLYEFIAGMIRENIGPGGMRYFPLIFTLFIVLFTGNALGLIPYSFTFTSHLVVTAGLALMIFLAVCILGIFRHGLHFFSLFLPPGVPWPMMPLIVPIEILSFMIRPVTLSVRLFANMMAGHILLKVIAGFAVGFMSLGTAGLLLGIFPTLFNVVLIGFELLIAYLQAYVFTVLSCIYLKDTMELEH